LGFKLLVTFQFDILILTQQEILYCQSKVAYYRDEQSYKRLFLYFHPMLFRFSYNILRNKCLSEEIVSDVMLKLWVMNNKLSQIQHLKLFLITSVKNASLTHLSSKKSSDLSSSNSYPEETHFDSSENPEERYIFSEVTQRVNVVVASLPMKCQLVFRLVKEEGMSYKEVSKILEISQNTIETHMRIALRKIRMDLQNFLK
jgi:RNA polymerase sigma-70 factor (family 1)